MMVIDDIIVSDELAEAYFVCDLNKCLGACCVDGDAGAPLEEDEISEIEDILDIVKPYMTPAGRENVIVNGVFDYDAEGNYVTPLNNGNECAYTIFNEGIAACAIEKAYDEGKVKFRKPVSCHLYPVRISKYRDYEAVNYHQWHICQRAVVKGRREGVPLYVFLKESLIRKYGAAWYAKLSKAIAERDV